MKPITIATAGNPNCGKTTLFNALTGARQRVGNWPGVTVDRKEGHFLHRETTIHVVDLPGTYSLGDSSEAGLDETIARDYILSGEADLVLNIVDASNLERNLYLTAQLIEMQVPMVVALNMMDMASENGLRIDCDKLASQLGCPVVPIIARRGKGIDSLKDTIIAAADGSAMPTARLTYQPEVEAAIAALTGPANALAEKRGIHAKWLAARLLEGDAALEAECGSTLAQQAEIARNTIEDCTR